MNEQSKYVNNVILGIIFFISIIFLVLGSLIVLSSCTLNMIMTHTEGEASDVVDSDPSTRANPDVHVSIPMIP